MGTRSLTLFFSSPLNEKKKDEKPFACMYRQFDGYLEGHGTQLAEYLAPRARINGISGETAENAANSIGCLAAQVVAYFKIHGHYKNDDHFGKTAGKIAIGDIYLQEYNPDGWQEFEYEVRPDSEDVEVARPARPKGGWTLSVYAVRHGGARTLLFEGTPADFLKKLEAGEFEEKEG